MRSLGLCQVHAALGCQGCPLHPAFPSHPGGPAAPLHVGPELRGWWSSFWLWCRRWPSGHNSTYQPWGGKQSVCASVSQSTLAAVPVPTPEGRWRSKGLSYRKCLAEPDRANSQEMLKICIIPAKIFLIFKRACDI